MKLNNILTEKRVIGFCLFLIILSFLLGCSKEQIETGEPICQQAIIKACQSPGISETCHIFNNKSMCQTIDWNKNICTLKDEYTTPGEKNQTTYQKEAEIWCIIDFSKNESQ